MISYNNSAPKAVNNVGQFGATEGSIGAYKSAAEYAADSKYWALLSQTKYSSVEEILAEVERLYAQGRLLESDIKQLKEDFEAQEQLLLGLIQSTGAAIDNTNAATELSKEATQEVLEQLDIISNMTVQATLLPPGSLATGSYDNSTGVFSFGIPEGQPGRDGTDGTISDIGSVSIGVPVADDYGFYVSKEDGGLYRADMSDIANLVPSVRSVSINGGSPQTGSVSFDSVSSFNGRKGGVTPQSGDYSVSQVTGAASSGDNSDITSLSGLSTAISINQGGTGAKTAADARVNLGLGSVSTESIIPVSKGGTGSTTVSGARTNLGLGSVSTESIVPIVKGGTGSTSAENARLALVAAKSGDNYDITSLNNLTTPLSLIQGGTGSTTVSGARTNLEVYSRLEVDNKTFKISVKTFGAIGDGSDHPLSEVYSTLEEAQIKYPFVTSLSQTQDYAGIQSAINEGKRTKSAVFIPSGVYVVNKTLVVDYAASIYGEGGQGLIEVNTNVHNNSDVKGTLIISKVATGHTISISPSSYEFGLTLRDFAIWGIDGFCDKGLYLHGVGWMGIVSGVNIQRFPNQGLEIGYIQDTYFNNCSVIQCGNEFNYAVTCDTDSNYVYFNGCHFELSAYLFKLVNCWNFSWNQCHFEVARPVRVGATQDDRYYYKSACIDLGSAYRLSFTNNTFIPVDAGYLSTKLSLDRSAVPYFMSSSGSYITFTNDIWLAPEGSIDVGYFSGSQVKMNSCQFISLNPSRPALHIENGVISGCTFAPLASDDALRLNCVQLNQGSFSSNQIGFTGTVSGGKRTSGFLFIGRATCNGNSYPDSSVVHKYLDNSATVNGFDGGSPRVAVTTGGDIDLTDHHPATSFVVNANGVTISHVYGSPYGRDLMITTNGTGTKINFDSATLITQGAVPAFELGQYRTAFFKSFSSSGSSILYQIS